MSSGAKREIELKAVVPDAARCAESIRRAGGRLVEAGTLHDERWDTAAGDLTARDEVLRIREFVAREGRSRASLDWKGPTAIQDGYKTRDEIETPLLDVDPARRVLERLGFRKVHAVSRDIESWAVHGAVARIERYPRMDVLVEMEGTPEAIEEAIAATGIPRREFTSERLVDFVRRFEQRTGVRAALVGALDSRPTGTAGAAAHG